ncbi:MAG TPA: ribbon-helix-helix domain-containing protein [Xanthobacteraceae bacterium]|nr:ribbon-helix-helix domain-containing protein [Xanthobacteraceae bacterium]
MIQKRSVVIAGHATSVSLEQEFWQALRQIARRRGQSLAGIVASADRDRAGNLSSALRLLVLESYRTGEIGRG